MKFTDRECDFKLALRRRGHNEHISIWLRGAEGTLVIHPINQYPSITTGIMDFLLLGEKRLTMVKNDLRSFD